MFVVRKEQLEAFSRASVKDFENRMVIHLRKFFPQQCDVLGEAKTREAVHFGIWKAKKYGIISEHDVCVYIDIMFTFGQDFDVDPALPWASKALKAKEMNPATKIEILYDSAMSHLWDAGGKNISGMQ